MRIISPRKCAFFAHCFLMPKRDAPRGKKQAFVRYMLHGHENESKTEHCTKIKVLSTNFCEVSSNSFFDEVLARQQIGPKVQRSAALADKVKMGFSFGRGGEKGGVWGSRKRRGY